MTKIWETPDVFAQNIQGPLVPWNMMNPGLTIWEAAGWELPMCGMCWFTTMVCWNELWPYWDHCTTLWDYQGKFHLQIGLLYHMNSIKFHNPTTDCTYLAAFLILNSGEVWSASSQTCRKWRNALEQRSCARNDWRCWTKRPITEKIRRNMGSRLIRDASCFYCG
jgi:hypothetical protein